MTDIEMKRIDRLRKVIESNSYTQERFASEILHVSHGHLRNVLRYDRRLTADNIEAVVKHFPYINFDWLMGISDIETVKDWMEKNGQEAFQNSHYRFVAAETIIRTFGYDITDVPSSIDGSTLYEIKAPDGKMCVLKSEEYKSMIFSMFDDMRAKLLLTFQKAGAQDGEGR